MLLFLRIYAVVYLVLFVECLILTASRGAQPSLIQLIDMIVFTPVAVVGLWSAAYRHLSLPKHGWKILLFAIDWEARRRPGPPPRSPAGQGRAIPKPPPLASCLTR